MQHSCTIDVEVCHGTDRYTVEFAYSDFVPAKTNCEPDDGYPEEGGEIEITGDVLLRQAGSSEEVGVDVSHAIDAVAKEMSWSLEKAEDSIYQALSDSLND